MFSWPDRGLVLGPAVSAVSAAPALSAAPAALAVLALLLALTGAAVAAPAVTSPATSAAASRPAAPAAPATPATRYPGIGRAATPAELAAWDIDVRPDFKGLPRGAGSVASGMVVWEARCASCHGVFGESNEVFAPLVGGTVPADIRSGRVARLNDASYPGRSTLMKLSSLSTLWDYIHRAMPWNAPKSLSVDEVYGVTAYLLNLGGVLPDDFVLSDSNIAAVQQRLPNRHGTTTQHGLWPGKGLGNGGRPDVRAAACMTSCAAPPRVVSALPDFARNQHGNLADQQRSVGPQRGASTADAALAGTSTLSTPPATAAKTTAPTATPRPPDARALALARQHSCTACHGIDSRIVGPGFAEITGRYAGRADASAYLAGKIRSGGQGVWGVMPMPPQSLPDTDLATLAAWLAGGIPAAMPAAIPAPAPASD